MAATLTDRTSSSHPAPRRHHVWLAALLFGIAGAPAAWASHLVLNFALASRACSPGGTAAVSALHMPLRATLLASTLAAIAISGLAAWVSYASWRATHEEVHGTHHQLLDIGEGRTRFLAIVGIVLSAGFLAATLFDALALILVPLCD